MLAALSVLVGCRGPTTPTQEPWALPVLPRMADQYRVYSDYLLTALPTGHQHYRSSVWTDAGDGQLLAIMMRDGQNQETVFLIYAERGEVMLVTSLDGVTGGGSLDVVRYEDGFVVATEQLLWKVTIETDDAGVVELRTRRVGSLRVPTRQVPPGAIIHHTRYRTVPRHSPNGTGSGARSYWDDRRFTAELQPGPLRDLMVGRASMEEAGNICVFWLGGEHRGRWCREDVPQLRRETALDVRWFFCGDEGPVARAYYEAEHPGAPVPDWTTFCRGAPDTPFEPLERTVPPLGDSLRTTADSLFADQLPVIRVTGMALLTTRSATWAFWAQSDGEHHTLHATCPVVGAPSPAEAIVPLPVEMWIDTAYDTRWGPVVLGDSMLVFVRQGVVHDTPNARVTVAADGGVWVCTQGRASRCGRASPEGVGWHAVAVGGWPVPLSDRLAVIDQPPDRPPRLFDAVSGQELTSLGDAGVVSVATRGDEVWVLDMHNELRVITQPDASFVVVSEPEMFPQGTLRMSGHSARVTEFGMHGTSFWQVDREGLRPLRFSGGRGTVGRAHSIELTTNGEVWVLYEDDGVRFVTAHALPMHSGRHARGRSWSPR